jgi:hypothetical protein
MRTLSNARIRAARVIAICADLVQIGLPFIFGEGFLSPFQDLLDVVVCVVMTLLVGWHHTFIPSFLIKLVPLVDLAPTWTIAVFIATRKGAASEPRDTRDERGIKDAKVVSDVRVAKGSTDSSDSTDVDATSVVVPAPREKPL